MEWIRCEDQQPDLYDEVLVTIANGSVCTGWRHTRDGDWLMTYQNRLRSDIIAWMPLPEPFTPVQQNVATDSLRATPCGNG